MARVGKIRQINAAERQETKFLLQNEEVPAFAGTNMKLLNGAQELHKAILQSWCRAISKLLFIFQKYLKISMFCGGCICLNLENVVSTYPVHTDCSLQKIRENHPAPCFLKLHSLKMHQCFELR